MNTNDQNPSIPAFARGGVSRSDTAELRLQAPRQLLAVFDAVSIARDKERYELILEELQKIADSADTEYFAKKVEDNGGVYVVPAFVGLGAPYWDMYARGGILGLTRGSNANHIIRAALESIAYQTKDLLEAMQDDSGLILTKLKVDGGAVKNEFLVQFLADIIGETVLKPEITETTALGAAYLAGMAVGFWKDKDDIKKHWKLKKEFKSELDREKRNKYYKGWKKAVERVRNWEREDI